MNNILDFNTTFDDVKNRIKNGFTKIPASIRYDRNVNDSQKILYSILVLLNNTYEFVYASNDYLSQLLNIQNTTLRDNLYKLRSLNYIDVRDEGLYRYIEVRKNDLNTYKNKIDIDVSTLSSEIQANYYSMISGDVLLSENISSSEKILYAEIMALTNKYGFAFISNLNLSKIMNISERQLIRCLNNLIKHNFIRYGKDIKSKRLIYVTHHYKKDFHLIDKNKYLYEVIENENNTFQTIRKSLKKKIEISNELDQVLDTIYKNIK